MFTRRYLLAFVGALCMIVAYGSVPALHAQDDSAKITGTVAYRDRMTLPADADINVVLEDVSRMDAAAEVVSEVSLPANGRQVPIPFELTYDPDKIVANHRYSVRATIRVEGLLAYTTTQAYPVITNGAPKRVNLILLHVGHKAVKPGPGAKRAPGESPPPAEAATPQATQEQASPAAPAAEAAVPTSPAAKQKQPTAATTETQPAPTAEPEAKGAKPSKAEAVKPPAPAKLTVPATFDGQIACADCEGIRVTITLRRDGIFLERYAYIGRDSNFVDLGKWSLDEDSKRLVLKGGKEAPEQWAVVDGNTLRKLTNDGEEINSQLNYTLTRAAKIDPFSAPFRMRGEYRFLADAGSFTECQTGLRFAVAQSKDNAALQRAYTKARSAPGAPLLVTLDGTLTRRAKAEGKGMQNVVIVDTFDQVWPDQTCSGATSATAAGAEAGKPEGAAANPEADAAATSRLANTQWRLLELNGKNVVIAPSERPVTLAFSPEGERIAGSAGCNAFMGTYRVEGGKLKLNPGTMTLMACPEPMMQRERQYAKMMSSVDGFRIDGDILSLISKGKVVAKFTNAEDDLPNAP